MNFAKFLKTPFLQNTLGRLLLELDTFTNSYNELLMNVFAVSIVKFSKTCCYIIIFDSHDDRLVMLFGSHKRCYDGQ